MTKTHLLDGSFDVPGRDFEVVDLPEATRSAITGAPLEGRGVEADSLLTSASSAPHEIFPYAQSDYVSEAGARCYKHYRGGLSGNLLAVEGHAGQKPMVSTKSADKKGRPNWQRLVFGTDEHASLPEGARCLAVFTEELHRRLWLKARVSVVGPAWQPFLYYGRHVRSLRVCFEKLREVLALCEYVYTLGFSKDNLLGTLFGSTKKALCMELGLARAKRLDNRLDAYRGRDELLLATFICQRAPDADPEALAGEDLHSTDLLTSPTDCRCLIPTRRSRKNSSRASAPKTPTEPTSTPPPETGQQDLFPS